ncbi:MAG: methyltransferase domain-containing protein [Candidatus Marinimicrobia bacterium]|nr:methyltransferase domain-containing protein [Candidatus Neomarinimicrobiota bacterium]MBL7023458.1 methyltransferase domain-containing protein [Candidatus Neomarinimicrobiota bacterium]MBL7109287.1 methyltransferase domain-containing protein [Candidatus Neomarinimicrobiota bacterium]
MKNYEEEYWASRSKNYNGTNWVKNDSFMDAFLSLLPTDIYFKNVLEIGIGTGAVAKELIKRVDKITGIDISEEMMSGIQNPQINTKVADAHSLPFGTTSHDLIYMRNVLHYLESPIKVISEINRCLENNGYFLFSQVIPFSDKISKEYDWLINRNIHYPTSREIVDLFRNFSIIEQSEFILKSQSVNNWLNNTCSDKDIKNEIVLRHKKTSPDYKKMVNYYEEDGDILIDIKHLLLLAKKI